MFCIAARNKSIIYNFYYIIMRHNNQQGIWCTFDGIDHASIIFQYCWIGVLVFVAGLFGYWLWRRPRQEKKYWGVQDLILYCYVLYLLVSVGKCVLNINAYEKSDTQDVEIMSYIFYMLDSASTLILTTLLFMIPCIWLRSTLLQVDEEELGMHHRQFLNQTFTTIRSIRIYSFLRVLLVVTILVVILVMRNHYISLFVYFVGRCRYGLYTVEGVFLALIYGWGMVSVKKLNHLLKIPREVFSALLKEYVGLMVVAFCRLLFNVLYNIVAVLDNNPTVSPMRRNCWFTNEYFLQRLILLVVGSITIHLVPLLLILYIYWPPESRSSDENEQLTNGYSSMRG